MYQRIVLKGQLLRARQNQRGYILLF